MSSVRSGNRRLGITAIETIVGVTLIAVVLLFTINAVTQFLSFGRQQVDRTQALYLAEQTLESVRFVRDSGWSNISGLSNGTTYYVAIGTSTIRATTTPQTLNGLTPYFKLSSVYRTNADNDIVASTSGVSKSVDANTRLVEATVAYGTSSSTVTLSEYLTNLLP